MYAQVEKPKENRSRAIANSAVQKKNFGFVDNRLEGTTQRKVQVPVDSSNQPIQFKKSNADKRATTSTHLTQAEAERLEAVARRFVGLLTPPQIAAFKILPNAAARNASLTGAGNPFRVGDVVEEVGQERLEAHATDKGKRGSVITSVTLLYCDKRGTAILGPLAELDALTLDSRGRVSEVVSAKLTPGQVAPARDRELLERFYAINPPRLLPNEKADDFYLRIKETISSVNKQILKNNNVVGFVVNYAGGSMPIETFRNQHPLAAGTVDDTPVIGLTPKSDAVGQAQGAEARGDLQLGLNRDALLEALGDAMLRLM